MCRGRNLERFPASANEDWGCQRNQNRCRQCQDEDGIDDLADEPAALYALPLLEKLGVDRDECECKRPPRKHREEELRDPICSAVGVVGKACSKLRRDHALTNQADHDGQAQPAHDDHRSSRYTPG